MKDQQDENIETAEVGMAKEDRGGRGIVRHSTKCAKDIDWKKSKVIYMEKGFKGEK